ncbi:MAG: hypothetical protein WC955_11030 [Elusimicrobiota bacterium]
MEKRAKNVVSTDTVKLISDLKDNGINIDISEGIFFLQIDYDFVYKQFAEYLPERRTVFLKQRALEIQQGFMEDAGVIIPWDNLRKRLIFWEDYVNSFPNTEYKDHVLELMKVYFTVYLRGSDNSETFSIDYSNKINDGVLKDTVRQSYENFIKENRYSKYYGLITDYYHYLQISHFKINHKFINNFFKLYKLE